MKNVFDIKKENNLNYILSKEEFLGLGYHDVNYGEILIIIHLHYEDLIQDNLKYIKSIPKDIRVIFTTSNDRVEAAIKKNVGRYRKKFEILKIVNRGRDISALLVACRKQILRYKYVCFVHDKKDSRKRYEYDGCAWAKCLWENTLASYEYIHNILYTFEKHMELGILVPPVPITSNYRASYENTWYEDFDLTKNLINEMGLCCDIDYQKPPITLGTVFWAKVQALEKLFHMEWKYEDFDVEPLSRDGTISHAIERILPYVAQDAGYNSGWVMTDCYAAETVENLYDIIKISMDCAKGWGGINCITDLKKAAQISDSLEQFCDRYKKVYIYGAGEYGNACLNCLKSRKKRVEAFLITQVWNEQKSVRGIPVRQFSKEYLQKDVGLIIAVGESNRSAITETVHLADNEFSNIFYYIGI